MNARSSSPRFVTIGPNITRLRTVTGPRASGSSRRIAFSIAVPCAPCGAYSPRTLAVAAGRPDADGQTLNVPIVLASNFRGGGEYSRTHGTETWAALEAAVGALEGGTRSAFSSGMAAASAAIYALAPKVLVLPTYCYLGVRALVDRARSARPCGGAQGGDHRHRGSRRRRRRVQTWCGSRRRRTRRSTSPICRRSARRHGRRRDDRRRLHVRHAAAATADRRRGDGRPPQRHQVHRRAQRPHARAVRHARRCRLRSAGAGAHVSGSDARCVGSVPRTARAAHARGADGGRAGERGGRSSIG